MRRTLAIPIGLVAASIAAGILVTATGSTEPTTIVTDAAVAASTLPIRPTTSSDGAGTGATTTTQPEGSSTSTSTTTSVAPTTTTPVRPPAEVRVVLANAAGRPGLASRNEPPLTARGYTQIETTDASRRVDTSSVYFAAGFDQEAAAVAATLDISAPPEPVGVDVPLPAAVTTAADVYVILGRDRP